MRRLIAITIAAAGLAAAGCGDDTSSTAQEARDQVEKAADQGGQAATQTGIEGLAAETQKLADRIAQAARELAKNPDANVDERLNSAEQRAKQLAEQARMRSDEQRPELTAALRAANERLASAAAGLREAQSADDVAQVVERQLGPAGDRLADAAGQADKLAGGDTERQLEQARDRIKQLREELPDLTR